MWFGSMAMAGRSIAAGRCIMPTRLAWKVLARMQELQGTMGDEFDPALLLKRLAAKGKTFADFDGLRTTSQLA